MNSWTAIAPFGASIFCVFINPPKSAEDPPRTAAYRGGGPGSVLTHGGSARRMAISINVYDVAASGLLSGPRTAPPIDLLLLVGWSRSGGATPRRSRRGSPCPLARLAVWAWAAAGLIMLLFALHQRPCLVDRASQRRRLLGRRHRTRCAAPSLWPIFRVLRRTINRLSARFRTARRRIPVIFAFKRKALARFAR